MGVKAIPDGYSSITPYLTVHNAAEAIEFYKKAFGATERMRLTAPDGRIGHAEIIIGNSVLMLASEFPEMATIKAPAAYGGTPVGMHLYVDDVDTVVAKAVSEGASLVRPVENHFYGDRAGSLTDPSGHRWHVSTHIEDVSPDDMKKRMAAMSEKHGP